VNDTIALIGNPNCGKTTLFNTLTGTYRKTGNWTGVTTESKDGLYKKDKRIKITDLPGLYSLNTKSDDEMAVLKYLKQTPPKAVINVLDGTNLERNLYLTLELVSLNLPTVIAVNMYDELLNNGIKLNVKKLSELFNVPVVPISALKGLNVDKLISVAMRITEPLKLPNNGSKQTIGNGYAIIESFIGEVLTKTTTRAERFTLKADAYLTHKYLGVPIFFLITALTYFLSMKIGGAIGEVIEKGFIVISKALEKSLIDKGAPTWMISLSCGAILKGIGTVTAFLPQILVLFICMAIIEQSGYAARIAFILDRFFRSFGLSGKSFIPMIVSCGCTVTGLMATRTIENKNERRMTVFLAPFMPCGAKTAVFGWFSYEFFGGSALVAASMYFLALISVAIFGSILKKFKAFKTNDGYFILEMPTLRTPSIKDVISTLVEKVKDFIFKVGSIVILVSAALWLLENFGFNGYTHGRTEDSFLFCIGNAVKFVFYPLGFGNWQASVSVLTGIFAKEAVVETICQVSAYPQTLFYNKFSAYAFMAFVLLSPPCIAAISTAKTELASKKWLLCMLMFQFLAGYSVAFIINAVGILLNNVIGLILLLILGIIASSIKFVIKTKGKCVSCRACSRGEKCQNAKRFTT